MLTIIFHTILGIVISIGLLASLAAISSTTRVLLYSIIYQCRNMQITKDNTGRKIISVEVKPRTSSKWAKVFGTFYLFDCFTWHFDDEETTYVSTYSFFMSDYLTTVAERDFSPKLKEDLFGPCFTDVEFEK